MPDVGFGASRLRVLQLDRECGTDLAGAEIARRILQLKCMTTSDVQPSTTPYNPSAHTAPSSPGKEVENQESARCH